jgi:hypothetical protein
MGDLALIDRGSSLEFVHRTWLARPRQRAHLGAEVRRWPAPINLPGRAEDDVVPAVSAAASNCVRTPTDRGQWGTLSDQPTRRGRGIEIMQQLIGSVLIRHHARGTRVWWRHPSPGDALNARHLTPDDSS